MGDRRLDQILGGEEMRQDQELLRTSGSRFRESWAPAANQPTAPNEGYSGLESIFCDKTSRSSAMPRPRALFQHHFMLFDAAAFCFALQLRAISPRVLRSTFGTQSREITPQASEDWAVLNRRRSLLIDRELAGTLESSEKSELEELQHEADLRIFRTTESSAAHEAMLDDLLRRGEAEAARRAQIRRSSS